MRRTPLTTAPRRQPSRLPLRLVGLRERITAAAGLGGAGLAAKRILVHFGHKYEPF